MADQCKNIFFYENGSTCNPQKTTKKAKELFDVIIQGNDGQWTFEGKKLFTLEGEEVLAFNPCILPLNTGFVLVGCEDFKKRNYLQEFLKMITAKEEVQCC